MLISFPSQLVYLFSYKASHQCSPHNMYFAFLCSTHRGKHVRRLYREAHRLWSREAPRRELCVSQFQRELPREMLSFADLWTCVLSSLILGDSLLRH